MNNYSTPWWGSTTSYRELEKMAQKFFPVLSPFANPNWDSRAIYYKTMMSGCCSLISTLLDLPENKVTETTARAYLQSQAYSDTISLIDVKYAVQYDAEKITKYVECRIRSRILEVLSQCSDYLETYGSILRSSDSKITKCYYAPIDALTADQFATIVMSLSTTNIDKLIGEITLTAEQKLGELKKIGRDWSARDKFVSLRRQTWETARMKELFTDFKYIFINRPYNQLRPYLIILRELLKNINEEVQLHDPNEDWLARTLTYTSENPYSTYEDALFLEILTINSLDAARAGRLYIPKYGQPYVKDAFKTLFMLNVISFQNYLQQNRYENRCSDVPDCGL